MGVLEKVLDHVKTGRSSVSEDELIEGSEALWRVCLGVFEVNAAALRGYEVLLVEEIQPSQGHYLNCVPAVQGASVHCPSPLS